MKGFALGLALKQRRKATQKLPIVLPHTNVTMSRSMNKKRSKNMWNVCLFYVVKIIRLYDYQTWETHFWRNTERYVSLFLD